MGSVGSGADSCRLWVNGLTVARGVTGICCCSVSGDEPGSCCIGLSWLSWIGCFGSFGGPLDAWPGSSGGSCVGCAGSSGILCTASKLLVVLGSCSVVLSNSSAISTSHSEGVSGGAVFRVLLGTTGVVSTVGVMGSSGVWLGIVAAGVWLAFPAGTWFCMGCVGTCDCLGQPR